MAKLLRSKPAGYFEASICRLLSAKHAGLALDHRGAPKYATKVGNPSLRKVNENRGLPLRWKRPWFLAMQRRRELEGEDAPMPRSSRRNWNYNAELAAFKLRLDIKCDDELLSTAFSEAAEGSGNEELATNGRRFMEMFVAHYVSVAFPRLPGRGKEAIVEFLARTSNIANLAANLGFKDLIQTKVWPPIDEVVVGCFMAVIEAINVGEGPVAAGRFILDIVSPQLVGKDIINDLWNPDNPMEIFMKELGPQAALEARLVRQSGVNTTTPVFFVALFSSGEFLVESGAESIPLAEDDAARTALKKLYRVEMASEVTPMGHRVDDAFLSKLFEPLLAKSTIETPRVDAGR